MKILFLYLAVVSLITIVLTVFDKAAAKRRKYRISEATLLLCAVFGGSVAELITMLIIRHKTRHIKFMLGLPVIIAVQAVLFAVLFIMFPGVMLIA